MRTEFTVGSDGKKIDIEIRGKTLSLSEAKRLRDQLNDVLPSRSYSYDCKKPRPKVGLIYPTGWHKR